MTKRRATRLAAAAAAALALAAALGGCASNVVDEQMPVGIGAGVNTLKKSPCACLLLPNLARG